MFRLALASCALFTAAGCMHGPTPDPERYAALGTEPFWSVKIGDGRMVYDGLGEAPFSVPVPKPRATSEGRRYETARLTLDIAHRECSDGMSDRVYADTVIVAVDGRALNGCGGAIRPPAALDGTHWAIAAIGDEPVAGEAYFLNFADGRLNGKAGCNGFSGRYRLSEGRIEPGPIMATRMACPGPPMRHEAAALAVLEGVVTVEHPSPDTLVLRGAAGSLTLRRSH